MFLDDFWTLLNPTLKINPFRHRTRSLTKLFNKTQNHSPTYKAPSGRSVILTWAWFSYCNALLTTRWSLHAGSASPRLHYNFLVGMPASKFSAFFKAGESHKARPQADLHHEMCGDGATLACSICIYVYINLTSDEMRDMRCKMRWNEMRWDKMGWGVMKRDETRCDDMRGNGDSRRWCSQTSWWWRWQWWRWRVGDLHQLYASTEVLASAVPLQQRLDKVNSDWWSWSWLNWIGLDWIPYNGIEFNFGSSGIEVNWLELNALELTWVGLDSIDLTWFAFDWMEFYWIWFIWIDLHCIHLNGIELNLIFGLH